MTFRTRIFAISILTVSVVLTVVATLSWSRIMKVELEHLDDRLCMEARRAMRVDVVPRRDDEVSLPQVAKSTGIVNSDTRFITDLMAKLRINSPSNVMVFVESDAHGVLIESVGTDIKNLISSLDWTKLDRLEPPDKNHPIRCQLASFEYKKQQWRASYFQSHNIKNFIAVDLSATTSELEMTLRRAFFVVIPFSLLLSIIGAWFITTTTIRPINRLHKSMDRVTQKDLSHRLFGDKEDKEFKVLIDAYNMMLERLEDSFQQVSRFTADAAHELKTPLTVLRGKLEQAVTCENGPQLDLNAILDEVGHVSAITRKLLLLSQADSGSMALHFEPINMTSLLDELTVDMALLSDELVFHCTIERALILKGDIVLMKQLFNNLLVNVFRYSLHEKGVTIKASQTESAIEILISNFCLPLSNEVRRQLFDRFYRGEPEQLQGISGSGLGLSLAREIARAHGGAITLETSAIDVFSMRLLLPIVK